MTAGNWRYAALIGGAMLAGLVLLGLLVNPLLGAAYATVYYVAYMRYHWLHEAAERITRGRVKR